MKNSRLIQFLDGLLNMNGLLVKWNTKRKAVNKKIEDQVDREIFGEVNRKIIQLLEEELGKYVSDSDIYIEARISVTKYLIEELYHDTLHSIKKQARKQSLEMHKRKMPSMVGDARVYLAHRDGLDRFLELSEGI